MPSIQGIQWPTSVRREAGQSKSEKAKDIVTEDQVLWGWSQSLELLSLDMVGSFEGENHVEPHGHMAFRKSCEFSVQSGNQNAHLQGFPEYP
jgi:hypothetical protein